MVALEPLELLLDVRIRDYVLVPILLVMFGVSVVRYAISFMFPTWPSKDLKSAYNAQIVTRVRRLVAVGSRIPKKSFDRRRTWLLNKDTGLLTVKSLPPKDKPETPLDLPAMDPSKMMQGQMSMVFNNLYIVMLYNIIEHFFSGFIAAKLPFSLTGGFKRMMHAGLDLDALEVTYVSSSSWYLLIFSGLQQVTGAIFGSAGYSMSGLEAQLLPQLPAGGGGLFGGAPESHKMFEGEKNLVAATGHLSAIDGSVARFVRRVQDENKGKL